MLWTGGKDSAMALFEAERNECAVRCLVTFAPPKPTFLAHPLAFIELQAQALQWLRQLLTEHQGNTSVDSALLDELESVGVEMTRELFPEVIGEVNTSGCPSPENYPYLQPVKVVELALLLGKRAGFGVNELHPLVMAALLKDVG